MHFSKERVGELCILSESVLWGLFPVVTILTLASITPLVSLGWSVLFATGVFAILLTIRGTWKDVWNTAALPDTLATAIILGVVYYILFFIGLKYTSAGNASIVALSEIFFNYCFFHLLRKEPMPAVHIAGAGLMLFGALLVLYPSLRAFQLGDLLIVAASCIAPLGNMFQRRARTKVSSESLLFVRTLISTPIIFLLAYLLGTNPFLVHFEGSLWLILALNGVFLLGLSKILWIEGIHRIAVTKASALASLAPLVTLLFAFILLHTSPTLFQLAAFIPMFFGVVLLGVHGKGSRLP
ncbi:MAG: DMT family transporter [Patescibacteria group bacterium]